MRPGGALARIPVSVAIAILFFIICALFVPRFASFGNLENVARIAAILAIVSCGQAVVLILGGIEFSFGSSVALASVVSVMLLPAAGPALAQEMVEEQPQQQPKSEVPPPTIDTNDDGVMDAWDRDNDGKADVWDTDGDGQPDAVDNDGDGKPDA